MQKDGKAIAVPKRMRVTYTLTVDTNAVPAGKLIRCWLPYPRKDQARQRDVKFVSASEPEYVFSPQDCRHSTLYMEKRAVKGEPTVFSETFEYTSCGEWHNLRPEDVRPYDTTAPLYKEYTAEREKHIVFSPRLRELAARLTAGETNPYLKAKRIFCFPGRLHASIPRLRISRSTYWTTVMETADRSVFYSSPCVVSVVFLRISRVGL